MMKKLLLLFCLFIGLSSILLAQKVKVSAELDKKTIQSGEPIQLLLTVNQTDDVAVIWPIINDTIATGFEIIERKEVDTVFNKEKTEISYKQHFTITNFEEGEKALAPFVFRYLEGNDTLFAQTNAIPIVVTAPEVDVQKEFRDIAGVQDIPFHWLEFFVYYVIVFVLILVGVIGYFVYRKWKKRPAPAPIPVQAPVIPAEVIAFEKLDQIKAKKLWQAGQIKSYYIELTSVIREYIDNRYKIDAEEMTTTEILQAIQLTDASQDARIELMKLLQLADLVKFAKGNPSDLENEKAWEQAHRFVEETKRVIASHSSSNTNSEHAN